jgi:DNA-binding MarR family transcriptional regulator
LQQLFKTTMLEEKKYIKSKSLGYLSGTVHGLIKKSVQTKLTEAGIPLKIELFPIINQLFVEDELSQQTLADSVNFDRHRMSRTLDELEKAGLIERKDDPNSRRINLICLTDYTKAHKTTIQNAVLSSIDTAFNGFSADETTKTIAFLEKIIENLK